MAGQPLTKAKRFSDWEDRLWAMLVELHTLAPRGKLAKQPAGGQIDFWRETAQLLERTTIAASVLLVQLETKAGMDAEALDAGRDAARGLRPQEATDGEAEARAENANQAAT